MKNPLLCLMVSAVAFISQGRAQCIADLGFRQAIGIACPECIDVNGCLLPAAKNIHLLAANGYGINNLSGIEGLTGLREFYCSQNSISTIPLMPDSLEIFYCSDNLITSMPLVLPPMLREFKCENNYITTMPPLPGNLRLFFCSGNALSKLPLLPDSIENLTCNDNYLSELPPLPQSLTALHCNVNSITRLPELPKNLVKLFCAQNAISTLPALPATLKVLDISYTHVTCLPKLPYNLQFFNYAYCNITCLPNIPGIFESVSPLPLCVNESGSSCALHPVVSGSVFVDYDGDAVKDTDDIGFPGLHVVSNTGNWMGYTKANGDFEMNTGFGNTYTIDVALPAGNYSMTTPTQSATFDNSSGQVIENMNFGIKPDSLDYDVAVDLTAETLVAGSDALYFVTYSNKSAFPVNGYVQLLYDSILHFISADLTPSFANAKKLKWIFMAMPPFSSKTIRVKFEVPDTIAAGTKIRQSAFGNIPAKTDIDSSNNTSNDSSEIQLSLPYPDYKTVNDMLMSPYDITGGEKLIYTICFQNTGNTKMKYLDIYDSLSANLMNSSLEILASSDSAIIEVGNDVTKKSHPLILHLKYPVIDLPVNDYAASRGFVKFSMKPVSTLGSGDLIVNHASLQLSNVPVLVNTDTVETHIEFPVVVTEPVKEISMISVYPNPFDNFFDLQVVFPRKEMITVNIYNLFGELVLSKNFSGNGKSILSIDGEGLHSGTYVLQVLGSDINAMAKIRKF